VFLTGHFPDNPAMLAPLIDGDDHHPDKTTDTIILRCQVKNIMHSAIVIDNSLLSRLPIDGIKTFIVEEKDKVVDMNQI